MFSFYFFPSPLHTRWRLFLCVQKNQMKEFEQKMKSVFQEECGKNGFCHPISWYVLSKLSSLVYSWKEIIFCAHHLNVRNFVFFISLIFFYVLKWKHHVKKRHSISLQLDAIKVMSSFNDDVHFVLPLAALLCAICGWRWFSCL